MKRGGISNAQFFDSQRPAYGIVYDALLKIELRHFKRIVNDARTFYLKFEVFCLGMKCTRNDSAVGDLKFGKKDSE